MVKMLKMKDRVNIVFQKSGNDYLIYKGLTPFHLGRIYNKLFFDILDEGQRKFVDECRHSTSFTRNILRLSATQFLNLVHSCSPNFNCLSHYEEVYRKAEKLIKKVKPVKACSLIERKSKGANPSQKLR
jgi:hypothetical protein